MNQGIVIERGAKSYGAYVLELPGCVAAARTRKEVVRLIQEAIGFHLEEMRCVPPSCSTHSVEESEA